MSNTGHRSWKRLALAAGISGSIFGPLPSRQAAATQSLCQTSFKGNTDSDLTTNEIIATAESAALETYANWDTYGQPGFCWYNNDWEDGTAAEGVDCSGLVAKAWELREDYASNSGYFYWSPTWANRTISIASYTWHDTTNSSWKHRTYDERMRGDAVARSGHVYLYVQDLPNGNMISLEARGHATGQDVGYWSDRPRPTSSEWVWSHRIGLTG